MNTKRKSFLTILVIVLLTLALSMFAACNKDNAETPAEEETPAITATEGLLISNSDFKVSSNGKYETYPIAPTGWTGASMYTSGSFPVDVVSGAINLTEALYTANKSAWEGVESFDDSTSLYDRLKAQLSDDEDAVNNVLMVYMPKDTDTDDDANEDDDLPNYGPTAYGFTSSSFSIAAKTYYKFSVDVLTYQIAGNSASGSKPGARIYLSSADYSEFVTIDTQGAWKHYEVYISGNTAAAKSLTVLLGLGNANSVDTTNGLTTGYAFFANAALTKVEDIEGGKTAKEQFVDAETTELAQYNAGTRTLDTMNLETPNAKFDFGTLTSANATSVSLNAPYGWSLVTGDSANSETAAPTSAERYAAIIDATTLASKYTIYSAETFNYLPSAGKAVSSYPSVEYHLDSIADSLDDLNGRVDKNVYMMLQQQMTASGIMSNTSVTVEKGKCYALSVWLYTYNVKGGGVTLELKGGKEDIKIQGISKDYSLFDGTNEVAGQGSSNGAWTQYTFYIEGNQYKDVTYTTYFWLGTDGTDKNTAYTYDKYTTATSKSTATTYHSNGTFSTGWVFFDDYSFDTIAQSDFDAKSLDASFTKDASAGATEIVVSLQSSNEFANSAIYGVGATAISSDFNAYADDNTSEYKDYDNATLGLPQGFTPAIEESITSPAIDAAYMKVGVVDTADDSDNSFFKLNSTANPGTAYDTVSSKMLAMYSSTPSYFALETSTFNILPNNFYRISMWVKTIDVKEGTGLYVKLLNKDAEGEWATKNTFSKVNTSSTTTDDDGNKTTTSSWQELVFTVRGAYLGTTECKLVFAFGDGTRWSTDTLASGAMYVSNMSMEVTTYSDYTSTTTGTYVTANNFSTDGTYSFTNGAFDLFDFKETEFGTTGTLADNATSEQAATPSNWTLTDSTVDDAITGVVQLAEDATYYTHSAQTHKLLPAYDATFDTLYGASPAFDDGYFGAPNLLAISAPTATTLGYKSDSFTLSANTNYLISAWVYNVDATSYSLYLTGESVGEVKADEGNVYTTPYFASTTTGKWTNYVFYVEVGMTSVKLQLELTLGLDADQIGVDKDAFTSVQIGGNTYSSLTATGLVLMDSVTLHSGVDTSAIVSGEEETVKTRMISYLADGFSPSSNSAATLSKISTATGWTGAVDGDASTSNTVAGIISTKGNHLPTDYKLADGSAIDYISVLGLDIAAKDITVPDAESVVNTENMRKYVTVAANASDADVLAAFVTACTEQNIALSASSTETEKREALVKMYQIAEATKQQKESWITLADVLAHGGDSCLVINNTVASAYTYTSAAMSLAANSYYRVSIWVRTFGITDATLGANLRLNLGNADIADEPYVFNAINKADWTQYSFYVHTQEDAVSSVKMVLGLGEYSADNTDGTMVKGYAFFDDFTLEKVTLSDFTAAAADTTNTVLTRTTDLTAVEAGTEEEPTVDEPDNSFDLEMLWWMIPTILLALITVIVVIVFFVKKIKLPKKFTAEDIPTAGDRTREASASAVEQKREDYDKFKE